MRNVREKGALLEKLLRERLGNHPNVGDIRGRGFFWGIEFVEKDQTPFSPSKHAAWELAELGLTEKYSIAVYPGSGTVDGTSGDHIIVSPAYTVGDEDVETIVSKVASLVEDYFASVQI